MRFFPLVLPFLLGLLFGSQAWQISLGAVQDEDHDGLSDRFEQQVLEHFLPDFRLSKRECAHLPAEFLPHSPEPIPVSLNGTIYGQVFPLGSRSQVESLLEIHYYHLWSQDCGRFGHDLDVEHVSLLVHSQSQGDDFPHGTRELYWYAAAHEGTLCEASSGVKVAERDRDTDITIWISSGKHASFLSRELCHSIGCGGDRCEEMVVFKPTKIINLGEPGAPLNGALWISSEAWPLAEKMESDFERLPQGKFDRLKSGEAALVSGPPVPAKAFLLGGNRLIGAVDTGRSQTGDAISATIDQTGRALGKGLKKAGNALKVSMGGVFGWLARSESRDPQPDSSLSPDSLQTLPSSK